MRQSGSKVFNLPQILSWLWFPCHHPCMKCDVNPWRCNVCIWVAINVYECSVCIEVTINACPCNLCIGVTINAWYNPGVAIHVIIERKHIKQHTQHKHQRHDKTRSVVSLNAFNMASFTNGQRCSQCLAVYPWPFYKCKVPDCKNVLCERCDTNHEGYCCHGEKHNGPDRNDYLKTIKKKPAAAKTKKRKKSK